jgi:succinate dehydrogenase / fumarate reductase flavoprotein subunit
LEDFGSKNFYAKGQTGQQLLLGAYSAMNRQIGRGKIKIVTRNARFGSD